MPLSASRIAADTFRLLPKSRLSQCMGLAARSRLPRRVLTSLIDAYCRTYRVDLREAVVPEGGYGSFNAFFTRHLHHGVRPLDPDPETVVSPADGRLEDAGHIDDSLRLRIKGRQYALGELLGCEQEAAAFRNGCFFVVYLSPGDYHRVHAPVEGQVEVARHVPGTLFPVNALGTAHIAQLFARNERLIVFQHSKVHGRVATVLVGAFGVGRISVSFDDLSTNSGRRVRVRRYDSFGPHLERGEELGVFNLGSTVAVFMQMKEEALDGGSIGKSVRVGQALARKAHS